MRVLSPDSLVGLTVTAKGQRGVAVARVINERNGVISWVIVPAEGEHGAFHATADQILVRRGCSVMGDK